MGVGWAWGKGKFYKRHGSSEGLNFKRNGLDSCANHVVPVETM